MTLKMIRSLEDLERYREDVAEQKRAAAAPGKVRVVVSLGSCGIAVGALEVWKEVENQIQAARLGSVSLSQTGCIGLCSYEPILEVAIGDAQKVTYGRVTPEIAKRIIREHVLGGNVVAEYVVNAPPAQTI